MAQKLTLVVTCTERKSAKPDRNLIASNLPTGAQLERAEMWRGALAADPTRTPLRRLYQGDAWTQALRLEAAAQRAGFLPTLLVASAGLGLVSADEQWPAYAATFSAGHADTVGISAEENRTWWRLMTEGQTKLHELAAGQTLLVLSETYSSAMAADLGALRGREDVVVFGGSNHVPDEQRVRADGSLRSALGGTSGSLNVRTAIAWLEKLGSANLLSRNNEEWLTWVEEIRKPQTYNRTPMTDSAVLTFIQELRRNQPAVSKTKALRVLRQHGMACEQKRFGGLFEKAAEEEGK